ncbi:MAG: YbhB/YbcL family Raf kinase inhibitor-like protein [Candidatus Tagabacteria bacterium CG_4_10_14_0_2_um_filter_40_13]|uniref:YbhB/YbcL family Raf kinase inhibitor-like protein n=3 Tax=Candidatus Tagaibacteriota TaxID=1817918 RepID=A0A2M8G906_9BACT|nr:MAG: YbhB/YbcL family Raf kinase inhibitor-like protein [Candidatus Tagabacteria bacterium CG11_big_fil_rev_8_21_14_0_20_41_11]PIU99800.1 MAG: YbhB/YbcL family Raf kinase inhibitor-like protein [Candidatus Tagabacteria bacterium CG03_land_8_20_14_0_80_41_22]PIZ56014.1 MAG: YbhB/YbcL family Raf kinase inhibitor-like protein [Candidatus Tagabacteria bacterium CG_4_10_14_0_2_um_filter_40_13]PJC25258.1 MAG: YbhB/YbcL family Raf kinase inhibitor-like protein [Candidatus Tagabacteria bacterium CG_4
MMLRCPLFRNNGNFPSRFTCDGANVNPPLIIEDVSRDAKSLVLIVEDPDATGGLVFTHWIIWNIPPDIIEIPEGQLPREAKEGRNDFGEEKYGGPCPPRNARPHRYVFKLYALNIALDLHSSSEKHKVEQAMEGHILEYTTLTAMYGRVT